MIRGVRLLAAAALALTLGAAAHAAGAQTCHYRAGGALPDPACTPGATDPAVRQTFEDTYVKARVDRVLAVICRRGYSRTVRPPSSYTTRLKRSQMIRYGAHAPIGAYQEDHLVPISLGGAPRDPANLWPMPERYAMRKDVLEHRVLRLVCARRIDLVSARGIFATDWRAAGQLGRVGA